MSDITEELAILLWHRFAPDNHIEWEDETHKAEYRDVAEAAIALMRDDCAMRAAAKFLDYCDAQSAPFTAIATLQALCEEGVNVEIDPKELLDFFSAALQQKESSL